LRFALTRLGHLFAYLPKQPGYNKRMHALAPQIVRLLNAIAFRSPSWCDNIRLLDSTPVPCGLAARANEWRLTALAPSLLVLAFKPAHRALGRWSRRPVTTRAVA
jgi:hypothetical protein